MIALTFTNPFILGGMALASLPIIIHLLNRRRFKQMEWAAMDFLLKAAVRNRKRVRLENLLLLILRTAIVVLLILAVARPFTQAQDALASVFGSEGQTERIVILDDSHSMRAGQGNRAAFEVAKALTRRMILQLNESGSGDRITLVLASDPLDGLDESKGVRASGENARRLADRVQQLRVSDSAFDVAGTIDALLRGYDESDARLSLDIVSDLRRRDWTDADGNVAATVREAMARFTERGEIRLLDVGTPPVQNLGVVELTSRARAIVAGVPTTFVARVKNHGPDPVDGGKVQVSFSFGDTRLDPVRLEGTLQPGETAEVTQEFTFRKRGPAVVQAKLPTEVLPGDDTRRLIVEVRKAMRFLLVDGEPDPENYRSESDFLAAALMPPGNAVSGIEVEIVPEQAFHERLLESVDALFLLNVYRLPEERVRAVEAYVRGGGGLVFFLGDQVDPAVYNATFYGKGDDAGKRLLPVQLTEEEGRSDDYVTLAPPTLDHPAIRFLRGLNELVFRTVHVRRFIGSRTQARDEARVLLNWTDEGNSPALIEKELGEGRVLLWTTTADKEWADLPRSLLFVPLMHELARYIVKPDPSETTRTVGSPIVVPYEPSRMQRIARIVPPVEIGGEPLPIVLKEREDEKGRFDFRYPRTPVAGVYTMRFKTPQGEDREQPFAYNMDETEGDLRLADRRPLAAMDRVSVQRASEESVLDADESDRTEFWRTLLLLMLSFAALESLLAWRFGHHSRRKLAPEGKQVFVR
ncbi:MAG: BatA domain-containing protein [Planctomycetota bacterium]